MSKYKYNPFTNKLDDVGLDTTAGDLRYWTLATAQTGLTGDKTGSFSIDTTGKGIFGATDTNGAVNALISGGGVGMSIQNLPAEPTGSGVYFSIEDGIAQVSFGISQISDASWFSYNNTHFTFYSQALNGGDGGNALDINSTTKIFDFQDFALTTTGTGTFNSVIIPTVFTAMTEPTGFVDRTATLSFVDATRVFTITGNHDIYINGVKTSKTTASITIDDATGMNWIYYNASGVLSQATSIPSFALPLIATLYYNTVTDKGLLGEERHGIKMDGDTHHLLHNTVGVRYESGLAGTFADTTFSVALGVIDDEDLEHSITPAKTTCNVLYKDGAADFKWLAGQTVYYYTSGGNLYYNNGNTLTVMDSNKYMAVWIFATNDTSTPIVSLIGQRQDTTIADARTNNKYESLTLGTLPFQEMKLLYRVILRNDLTPYEEAQDLRNISNLPAGTYVATDHGVLTGLTDDDHSQYWLSGVSGRTDNYETSGTLGAGAITGTSFIIGANTLNTTEWAFLDGQDQSVFSTSSPTFNALTVTTTINGGTLYSDTTDQSLKVGYQAGLNVVAGAIQGMYLGYQAGLASATLSTVAADYNIAIGYRSLYSNQSGSYDIAIGAQSLQANTSGPRNIAIGHRALYVNTSGADNIAIGYRTLYANLTGGYNFAIGTQALYQHTAGNYNVAMGLNTLYDNLTGGNNLAVGYYAGRYNLGSSSVFLGYYGGAYETGSSTLYIDAIDRTDSAGDRGGALLYGIFNATPASQSLTTNVGNFNITDVGTVGAEKLTNGTFTGNTTSWTLGAVWFYGYAFTVSGVTTAPTAGATYTNNSVTYTVKYSVITDGAGTVFTTGASDPTASGTLVKASGTGDANITFSAFVTNEVFKCVDGTTALTQTSAAMVTPLIIGELYYLSYEISDWTVGTVTPSCGEVTMPASAALNGTNSGLFVATSTATLSFAPSSTARFTIDTISLKKVTGGNLNLGGNVNLMGQVRFGTTTEYVSTDNVGYLDLHANVAVRANTGLIIPSGTTPTPNVQGAIYIDTDLSTNGSLMCYSNGSWRKVIDLP